MDRNTAYSDSSRRLKERLRRELNWLRLRLAGHAALMLLGGLGLLFGAAVLSVPGWARFGSEGAWAVWIVALIATALVVVFELVRPLRRTANLKGFTRELERHADYGNLLEAATQFSSPKRADPLGRGASPDLVAEIMRRASDAAEASRLAPRIPLAGVAPHFAAGVVALLLWGAIGVFAPARVRVATDALLHPSSLAQLPPQSGLYATSRDQRVPVGGEIELVVQDFAAGDEPVLLEINRTGDFWQQEPTRLHPAELDPAPYRESSAQVKRVEDPFRYRFRKGLLTSPVYRVEVRERPIITELRLVVRPPAYSGQPTQTLANPGGAITVLVGTEIDIAGLANAPIAGARQVEESGVTELSVEGTRFAGSFVVEADRRFRIELTDHERLTSEARSEYQVLARTDEAPSVEITAPARDLPLERDLRLQIAGIAADDVGLARLDLVYRTDSRTEWTRLPLFVAGSGAQSASGIGALQLDQGALDVAVNFVWDLGDLQLLPGDALLYALEATDNNARVGGQVTRSQVWSLRLPTIAEVFDIDREERTDNADEMKDLLAEGQQLKDQLERLERELKKDPRPDWEKQQEIRDTLEKQQALRERMQEALGDMQQQLEEFERNNSGSLELLQKMETVQELMQELRDDESLQAYLDAMRDAMDELQPHEIQRNMEDARNDQEEFNRRLDRTIELLRQLERERTMSDLVEELNEYLRRQDQLAELTQPDQPDADPSDPSGEEQVPGDEPSDPTDPTDPTDGTNEDPTDPSSGDPQDAEDESSPSDTPPDDEGADADQDDAPLSDEELARMQEQLQQETEQLEERIREALEQLQQEQEQGEAQNPSAQEMREALEKALEELEKQRPSDPMKDAQEQLAEGDRQEAGENQDEARKRLLSLYEVMLEGQQMMQQAQGKWAGEQLQQAAFDLLQLSHRQEGVIDAVADGVRGQRTQPVTREQSRIQRAVLGISEAMEELARQDFSIPERMLAELRKLVGMAEEAVDELQLGRARLSQQVATEVMGNMNQIVISLLTAARNSQGGSGTGQMPSPSQQMRELAQDQSRLNGMTQELRRRGEQGFSPEERRQLAELQGQQQAIRDQLEKIREQIDDERRVLGDLDELGKQMERVEDDLETGELTQNTERQQDKILSRLLDAERSIRERDFAKRRESRGAEDVFSQQDGLSGLPGEEERENAVRRFVAPELAPEIYREDVRRYFRSIQRELDQQREGGR